MLRLAMLIIALASAALALNGCSMLQQKVTMDAAAAEAMATAAGHPERAMCYAAIEAYAEQVQLVGLLALYEAKLEGRQLAEGVCAPVVAGASLDLLGKVAP